MMTDCFKEAGFRRVSKGPSNSEMCFQSKLLNRKYVPHSHGLFHVRIGSVTTLFMRSHPMHRKLHQNVPSMFLVKRVNINLG